MRPFRSYLCLHAVLLVSCSLQAQTPKTTSVVGPRPVRDVILQWEKQYGWVITYEDPRFEYASDLEDVTEKVRRDLRPGEPIDPNKRIIVARERQLSVAYKAPKTAYDTTAQLEAAKQLVNAFAKSAGNTFLVSQSGTRVHVLPGLIRDASGQLQSSRPILGTVISLPSQDRDGVGFLHAFCDALASATGRAIFVGTIPSNSLAQFHTETGYENLPARQILEDFLNRMPNGQRYTWALLFQKDYALNIHWVRDLNQPFQTPPKADTARSKFIDERSSGNGAKAVSVVR